MNEKGMRMTMTRRAAKLARKAFGLMLMLALVAKTAEAGAGPPPAAPEIDPGSLLSAMTLLGGGLMILTDRRAKAKAGAK